MRYTRAQNGKKEPALPKDASYERQISVRVKHQQKTLAISSQRFVWRAFSGCRVLTTEEWFQLEWSWACEKKEIEYYSGRVPFYFV